MSRFIVLASALLAACGFTGNSAPDPVSVVPRTVAFRGDTLRVALADARNDSAHREQIRMAMLDALHRAYPEAVVRPLSQIEVDRYPPGTVTTLRFYSPTWTDRWNGITAFDASVTDRRAAPVLHESMSILRSSSSSVFQWKGGGTAQGDALRESFNLAVQSLIEFADSLGQPGYTDRAIRSRQRDSIEYAAIRPGSATIFGQALFKTRGGDVKMFAGGTVTLDPATTLAKRRYLAEFGAANAAAKLRTHGVSGSSYQPSSFKDWPADSLILAARKTTTVDADGRFRFDGLSAGDYIVRSAVTWEANHDLLKVPGAWVTEGVIVSALVTVRDAERVEVILSSVGNALAH